MKTKIRSPTKNHHLNILNHLINVLSPELITRIDIRISEEMIAFDISTTPTRRYRIIKSNTTTRGTSRVPSARVSARCTNGSR